MGTNYYLIHDERPPCSHCCRPYPDEKLHIGKSSCGWVFALHFDEAEGLTSLEAWIAKWSQPGWRIEDECGDPVSTGEMYRKITERRHPHGLTRHTIGPYCVGHGEGTWDLVPGEFS